MKTDDIRQMVLNIIPKFGLFLWYMYSETLIHCDSTCEQSSFFHISCCHKLVHNSISRNNSYVFISVKENVVYDAKNNVDKTWPDECFHVHTTYPCDRVLRFDMFSSMKEIVRIIVMLPFVQYVLRGKHMYVFMLKRRQEKRKWFQTS